MHFLKATQTVLAAAVGTALLMTSWNSVAQDLPSPAHQTSADIDQAIPHVEPGPPQLEPQDVLDFWSYDNMKKAETSSAMPISPTEDPYWPDVGDMYGHLPVAPTDEKFNNYVVNPLTRINGVLFFVQPGTGDLAHCSASVIRSPSKSIVLTGSHCVYDHNGWKDMAMFVPAYKGDVPESQRAPLGKWVVKQAFIPRYDAPYTEDDVAVVRVYPVEEQGTTLLLQDVVGNGLVPRLNEIGEEFPLVDVYGYPGTGVTNDKVGQQWHCLSRGIDNPVPDQAPWLMLPQCGTQSGNSGGSSILSYLDGRPSEVVAVYTKSNYHSRLTAANFSAIFAAADNDATVSADP